MSHEHKNMVVPILCVDSVDKSLAYYRDRLDFKIGFRWSAELKRMITDDSDIPADFASVCLMDIELFLAEKGQGHPGTWLCINFFKKSDYEMYISLIEKQGAIITQKSELKPWGIYETIVSDPDGHVLRIGGPTHD